MTALAAEVHYLDSSQFTNDFHDFHGIPVVCTYHPAYLLRSPENKKYVWEDMKMLLERMGRPVPAK